MPLALDARPRKLDSVVIPTGDLHRRRLLPAAALEHL